MFGRLKAMGVDRDRIVPVAFHVDYFNAPWKDPFSQKAYSQRQFEYSLIYQRENDTGDKNTLYFTPMLMVDGRHPMLGSDPPKAQAALRRTLGEKPAASIAARLVNDPKDPRRKTLSASVAALTLGASGRDLLVGVAIWEDPVTTKVTSGENAGETLVEHYAVRKFDYQRVRLEGTRPKALTFPLELGDGWDAAGCGVAVFVQDWNDGRVHQAESLPWEAKASRATAGTD